jgi:hypothetical protein
VNEDSRKALDSLTGLSISYSVGEPRTVKGSTASWAKGSTAPDYRVVTVRLDSGSHYTEFQVNADLPPGAAVSVIADMASRHVSDWIRKSVQVSRPEEAKADG